MKAVIFDLDDTLYPERQFVFSGFKAVADLILQKFGVQDFFETQKAIFDAGERKKIFDMALTRCGIALDPGIIKAMLQIYRTHDPQIGLYEDVIPTLDYCCKHYKTGIITDGYAATQKNKVHALKLDARFDVIVYSDDFGRENWKPSAVPYQKMCKLLQVKPEQCVYVGDNPDKDFIAAKELGWLTIRVLRQGTEHAKKVAPPAYEADRVVNCWDEIIGVLIEA